MLLNKFVKVCKVLCQRLRSPGEPACIFQEGALCSVFSVKASGNHKVVVELMAAILGCVIKLRNNFAAER